MKNTTEPERFSRTDDPAVPDLTIIAPVYKNASTLDELAARITSTSEQAGYTFEILFVDDACPQGSLDVLKRLASRDDRVSVISLAQNTGQAQAVMTGLDHLRSRFFVIMDADLQDPPEAIPELVRGLEEGYDVVFAGRAGHYESSGRLATSRLYKWTIHILTGLPADAGLFLAARRIVAEKLLAAHQSGILIVPMIGTFKLRTFSIPVERALRPVGESAYTGWMRMKVGFRAAAWALLWKFKALPRTNPTPLEFPVAEFIGVRFNQNPEV